MAYSLLLWNVHLGDQMAAHIGKMCLHFVLCLTECICGVRILHPLDLQPSGLKGRKGLSPFIEFDQDASQ